MIADGEQYWANVYIDSTMTARVGAKMPSREEAVRVAGRRVCDGKSGCAYRIHVIPRMPRQASQEPAGGFRMGGRYLPLSNTAPARHEPSLRIINDIEARR